MIRVSAHAVQRYQERVANLPAEQAKAALSTPAVERAADFGASFVRLGTRHRIVLDGHTVVTVLPAETPAVYLGSRRGLVEASRG